MPREANLIEEVLRGAKELPTLPHVIARILRMTGSPDANAADVAKLISNDPALSARILRVVNSAFYGFARKVSSVTRAIVLLGFAKVKNIAVTAAVAQMFTNMRRPDEFDFREYWEHAVATSLAAEQIAARVCPEFADEAFVAGLLCEVGKALLAGRVPDRYREALKNARVRGQSLDESELDLLGCRHNEVGAEVLKSWNFPESLISAIRQYRTPDGVFEHAQLVRCVHVANSLSGALGWLGAGERHVAPLSSKCIGELGLNEESLLQIASGLPGAFANSATVLELAA